MLNVNNLSAGYNKKTVINNLSFSINQNSLVSIIGENGSGKSTLLKAISNLNEIFSGEVTVDGINTKNLKRKEFAQKVTYLTQMRNIPDMTVGQLVLHGRFPYLSYPRKYSNEDLLIAEKAIKQMGLSGYEDRPLKTLSGGQVQKAYIALSLAQNTNYILFDEPTTFLDTAHQINLMGILRNLADSGKGIVTVMHDISLAFNYSDCIMVINEGDIVAFDTPENILKSDIINNIFGIKIKQDNGIYYCLIK